METSPAKVTLPVVRDRASPFSYRYGACNRCCFGKVIPLGPYEVARLAHTRGITTTEFLTTHTTRNATALLSRDDGGCVLLGERGSSVRAARPLGSPLHRRDRRAG